MEAKPIKLDEVFGEWMLVGRQNRVRPLKKNHEGSGSGEVGPKMKQFRHAGMKTGDSRFMVLADLEPEGETEPREENAEFGSTRNMIGRMGARDNGERLGKKMDGSGKSRQGYGEAWSLNGQRSQKMTKEDRKVGNNADGPSWVSKAQYIKQGVERGGGRKDKVDKGNGPSLTRLGHREQVVVSGSVIQMGSTEIMHSTQNTYQLDKNQNDHVLLLEGPMESNTSKLDAFLKEKCEHSENPNSTAHLLSSTSMALDDDVGEDIMMAEAKGGPKFGGAGARSFPTTIKNLVKENAIDILCLLETRISGNRADNVSRRLGFSNWIRLEASGFAGGIWILWNDINCQVDYLSSTTQLVHCRVFDKKKNKKFLITAVYGEPVAIRREGLWLSLQAIACNVEEQWLVFGDFNMFIEPDDKMGGSSPSIRAMKQFGECIKMLDLLEIPFVGERFTWEKKGVKERLDWVFGNVAWELGHPDHKVFHKLRYKSDHRLIIISNTITNARNRQSQNFKYNAAWALEENFSNVVRQAWETGDWYEGKRKFETEVNKWNSSTLGNIPKRRLQVLRRIEGIDRVRQNNLSNGLFKVEQKL